MVSLHATDGYGRPTCWHWGLKELRAYVTERYQYFVDHQDQGQQFGVSKNQVQDVLNLILYLLDKGAIFAHSRRGKVGSLDMCVDVSLYECELYPITDIFTAFGWFITVTDGRTLHEGDNIIYERFKTVLLFSRLLYNLSSELGVLKLCPSKTHMFLSLDYKVPLFALGVDEVDLKGYDTESRFALSTSLPDNVNMVNYKAAAAEKRVRAIKRTLPNLKEQDFSTHSFPIGYCAETLNALSASYSRSGSKSAFIYGVAIQIKSMNKEFGENGFAAFLTNDVAVPPCSACCQLFKELDIKFFDISKLVIHGVLLQPYVADEHWTTKVLCECCHYSFPLDSCERCFDCGATWCNPEVQYPDYSDCRRKFLNHVHNCPPDRPKPKGPAPLSGAEAGPSTSSAIPSPALFQPSVSSTSSDPGLTLTSQFAGMQIQSTEQRSRNTLSRGQDERSVTSYHGTSGFAAPGAQNRSRGMSGYSHSQAIPQEYQYGQSQMQNESIWRSPPALMTPAQPPFVSNPEIFGSQRGRHGFASDRLQMQTQGLDHQNRPAMSGENTHYQPSLPEDDHDEPAFPTILPANTTRQPRLSASSSHSRAQGSSSTYAPSFHHGGNASRPPSQFRDTTPRQGLPPLKAFALPSSQSAYAGPYGETSPAYPSLQGVPGVPQAHDTGGHRRVDYASVVARPGPAPGSSRAQAPASSAVNMTTISAVPGELNADYYGARIEGYDGLHKSWHKLNKDEGNFSFSKRL